jgi:hypothetical protein
MPTSAERPKAVWRADCPESRGVGMRMSSGLADRAEQAPPRRVRSRALCGQPPEFDSLPVSHLRTCVSVCCGVVLFSIVTGSLAASRLMTPWRSGVVFTGVPCPFQNPARASQLNLRAKRSQQPGARSFAAFPASRWLAPIDGCTHKSQHWILIGKEDLQNGKTKHTT